MKFKCFFLFAASMWLVDVSPALSAPAQTVAQIQAAPDAYQNCKKASSAVVTIYAGTEIGSGSIISPDGVVITNQHVVQEILQSKGKKPIYVNLPNGENYTGKLLQTDAKNDLALVKINAQAQFPTVPLAIGKSVHSGEAVCAIGSPFNRPGTLTRGVFKTVDGNGDLRSAVRLNPGNSGGPLLNAEGELIGVNKSAWYSNRGENTGISFATSAQIAKKFAEQSGISLQVLSSPAAIAAAKPVTAMAGVAAPEIARIPEALPPVPPVKTTVPRTMLPSTVSRQISPTSVPVLVPAPEGSRPVNSPQAKGRLGLTVQMKSLIVERVEAGSPAEMAGLQMGDRLVAVNGKQLRSFSELKAWLNRGGDSAMLTIQRDRQLETVQVSF